MPRTGGCTSRHHFVLGDMSGFLRLHGDKYLRNTTMRRDPNVKTFNETIAKLAVNFYKNLNYLDKEVPFYLITGS